MLTNKQKYAKKYYKINIKEYRKKYIKEYRKKYKINKNNFIRNTTKIKCNICNHCFLKTSIKGHLKSKNHYLKSITFKYKKPLNNSLLLDLCNLLHTF